MTPKWTQRFLRLADHVAQWSKDPSTKVGAVIIDADQRIVSLGYNGFPRKVKDKDLRERPIKYLKVIHAEMNAILYAREDLKGCHLFCTNVPCSACTAAIIQSGISSVTYYKPTKEYEHRWHFHSIVTKAMLKEAGYSYKKDPR